MKKEENYIIKFKNSRAYIKESNDNEYSYTFNIEKAKRMTKSEAIKNCQLKELQVVEYSKEKYEAIEERYKIYAKILSMQKNTNILEKDLDNIKVKDKCEFYLDLNEKYPDNKLVREICRVVYFSNELDNKNKEEFDYDYESQMKILEETFNSKYTINLLQEENEDIEEI